MPDETRGMPSSAREAAIRRLWNFDLTRGERLPYLYALLDAAQSTAIFGRLRSLASKHEIACLYQGAAAVELATVAPYLICLGTKTDLFDWIWEEGWGRHWGIFIWSPMTLESLRSHLRRLTKVRTEDGRNLLFRFYDPRVLSRTLLLFDAAQTIEFFGPGLRFFSEAKGGHEIVELTQTEGRLRRVIHTI